MITGKWRRGPTGNQLLATDGHGFSRMAKDVKEKHPYLIRVIRGLNSVSCQRGKMLKMSNAKEARGPLCEALRLRDFASESSDTQIGQVFRQRGAGKTPRSSFDDRGVGRSWSSSSFTCWMRRQPGLASVAPLKELSPTAARQELSEPSALQEPIPQELASEFLLR